MNKKILFIIHGWDGNPKEILHQLLRDKFFKEGFEVHIPNMPNPDKPKIDSWVNKLKEIVKNPDKDTYFIWHSIGSQAVLRYLETLNSKIAKVILIAPWMHLDRNTIKEEGEEVIEIAKPWMETPIKWERVMVVAKDFLCVFSDNDPYVPLSEKDLFKKKLGAKITIENNMGHFTDETGENKLSKVVDKLTFI